VQSDSVFEQKQSLQFWARSLLPEMKTSGILRAWVALSHFLLFLESTSGSGILLWRWNLYRAICLLSPSYPNLTPPQVSVASQEYAGGNTASHSHWRAGRGAESNKRVWLLCPGSPQHFEDLSLTLPLLPLWSGVLFTSIPSLQLLPGAVKNSSMEMGHNYCCGHNTSPAREGQKTVSLLCHLEQTQASLNVSFRCQAVELPSREEHLAGCQPLAGTLTCPHLYHFTQDFSCLCG
jgi:hypothetical protein